MPADTNKGVFDHGQAQKGSVHARNVYAFKDESDSLKTWQNIFNALCAMRWTASASEHKFLTYLIEMAALETQNIITNVRANMNGPFLHQSNETRPPGWRSSRAARSSSRSTV